MTFHELIDSKLKFEFSRNGERIYSLKEGTVIMRVNIEEIVAGTQVRWISPWFKDMKPDSLNSYYALPKVTYISGLLRKEDFPFKEEEWELSIGDFLCDDKEEDVVLQKKEIASSTHKRTRKGNHIRNRHDRWIVDSAHLSDKEKKAKRKAARTGEKKYDKTPGKRWYENCRGDVVLSNNWAKHGIVKDVRAESKAKVEMKEADNGLTWEEAFEQAAREIKRDNILRDIRSEILEREKEILWHKKEISFLNRILSEYEED